MEDRQLSLSEVAGLMGVSERTVRRWIKSGKLRAYKPGRDYRIPESAFREFVEESQISPKAHGRSSLEPSLFNGLEEERRASWEAAVDNARRLREGGRTRLEELLAAWQASRERGELRSARRGYLDEIVELFNKAHGATHRLADLLFAEGGIPAQDDWEEVRAADRFYWTLIEMMKNAGFVIQEHNSEPPTVEEPAA
jgi:excisionase family DNA binding protein